MIKNLDHIGIAVVSLEESIAAYQMLGFGPARQEEVPEQKVRVGIFSCGESTVELLQTTDPDGPVGRFIAKRGPGIHHLAFRVDDIEGALAELKSKGVQIIDEVPRIGAGGRGRPSCIQPPPAECWWSCARRSSLASAIGDGFASQSSQL
jgi:methylmalonyl-CoA/ethylmalonyl-CoA epimerase